MNVERDGFPDELIERVASVLTPLPSMEVRASLRIMAAVRSRRRPSRFALALSGMRDHSVSLTSAGMLMAAALVLGFISRGALTALRTDADELATTTSGMQPVAVPAIAAGGQREMQAVPVPLVFEGGNARSVAIVGDFNGWDATASPMQRFGTGGPWTATVLAKPGRHVYAFLVDGTTLVADPRAPHARDLDYGGDASVLMVTVP
jgi:hypothetical protein